MNTIDEKTFKQGVDEFIGCAPEGGWSDYWAMQQDWEFYKDSLCRDGVITQKQADSWSNPCTPETFARWQKRNGLVRRGYESKKSEGVEALKDKVVSDGTLKPEDLIPKFLNALKHDETAHSKFLKDNPEILEIQSWDDVDDETKSMLVDELTDALNDIAPDGYFFGASDGDGACFGFWKVDPDESKKSEGGSIRDTKCVRCGGSPAMYKLDGCSGNFCLSCAKELHWECPKELKDKKTAGKKESMERCDSCGAVMTEYDYDRYGGLCKRCRDKGEAKKSEGFGNMIDAKLDYTMFMRMCKTAAYLKEDEDYWDALWEYYSELGNIGDALVFFDNLFQYTAWCDADEVYDEYLDEKFKDNSKSKEECIDAAIDDGDLQAYKHEKGNYLVIF